MQDQSHLKIHEDKYYSFEEALKIARDRAAQSMQDERYKKAKQQLVENLGEEQAEKLLDAVLEDEARRMCLISVYGLDAFLKACEGYVMPDNPLEWPGSIKEIEERLING